MLRQEPPGVEPRPSPGIPSSPRRNTRESRSQNAADLHLHGVQNSVRSLRGGRVLPGVLRGGSLQRPEMTSPQGPGLNAAPELQERRKQRRSLRLARLPDTQAADV